jgi:hypothetical protein
MQDDTRDTDVAGRRSASAEAAALRWREQHPDEDAEAAADQAPIPERDEPGERRSAAAEAAALRWQEQHPDED